MQPVAQAITCYDIVIQPIAQKKHAKNAVMHSVFNKTLKTPPPDCIVALERGGGGGEEEE